MNVVAAAFLIWPAGRQAIGPTTPIRTPPPPLYPVSVAGFAAGPVMGNAADSFPAALPTDSQSAKGTASRALAAQGLRPNIVVIMTDDQDDMGSMSAMPSTRSLIGDSGLTFTNSFTDFPLCCPSRASFLTGQAAHNTGVLSNTPAEQGGFQVFEPSQANSLPVWLQQAGYTTAHMGKYLNGFDGSYPIPPGWTSWFGIADGQGAYYYYSYSINRNGVLQSYGSSPTDYKTDVQTKDAEDFIASQTGSSQPFFLWLNPIAPHSAMDPANPTSQTQLPAVPAPRHAGIYDTLPLPGRPNFNEADVSDKPAFVQLFPLMGSSEIADVTNRFRRRRESLLSVDEMVQHVVSALQAAGKLANTYIIFTADNGDFEGQHRRRGNKMLAYEESIRVPLLIRGPGIAQGEIRDQLVNNLDLTATILELTGVTPGRSPDGKSLAPLFQNPSAPWRSSLLVQGLDKVSGDAHAYGRYQAVRTNRYIYIEHNGDFGFEKEFYDLAADPYELTSKPSDPAYASIVNDLQGRLNTLRTCAGANCWMTTAEPPPPLVGQSLYTLSPCRLVDTRWASGPFGGPPLAAGSDRVFVLTGQCAIPAGAKAVSINATVTGAGEAGDLRLRAGGTSAALSSTINYRGGQTRANNAVVGLGSGGDIVVTCVQGSGGVHLIVDVNGYFQ